MTRICNAEPEVKFFWEFQKKTYPLMSGLSFPGAVLTISISDFKDDSCLK